MRGVHRGSHGRRSGGRSRQHGQGLVEFALTLPIFVLVMMAVIEYGFLYNNILTIQYASRQGAKAAAEAGGVDGADCSILKAVEAALTAPIDKAHVTYVDIFQSDANGDPIPGASNHYVRSGTLDCPGDVTEPYTLIGTEGYPQITRHDALVEGLEVIGVQIGYLYYGFTPIGSGRTWSVSDGATLRMEPKQ